MFDNTPYKKGYLSVSDTYELYYEFCGNPNGKPILYLHGGPGSGFHEKDKEFFDPKVWNMIFFDQRGAGRSKPFASIKNNTTQKIVEDIHVLLQFAGIEKTYIFGGSWGSTLALVYAITYPKTVLGMILRGIWLVNERDSAFYLGGGSSHVYPEAWERFISQVPEAKREDIAEYYLSQMNSQDKEVSERYKYEWALYETSIMRLQKNDKKITEDMSYPVYKSLSPIEAHFIKNKCFLPNNFILNNAKVIATIPTTIIHGRYDMICPAENAYLLHKALKRSKLIYTQAGHSSSDTETKHALIEAVKKL